MPNYRRYFVPGGTYFFTLKTEHNHPLFERDEIVELFESVLGEAKSRWPFEVIAYAILPDHIHTLWSLPSGDTEYPTRWGWIKKEFTTRYLSQGGTEEPISSARQLSGRKGVWQRHYWEHLIRDEEDFERHFDYIHWNPVKHHYVKAPRDWAHSSFHQWVNSGHYEINWGRGAELPDKLLQVLDTGE